MEQQSIEVMTALQRTHCCTLGCVDDLKEITQRNNFSQAQSGLLHTLQGESFLILKECACLSVLCKHQINSVHLNFYC